MFKILRSQYDIWIHYSDKSSAHVYLRFTNDLPDLTKIESTPSHSEAFNFALGLCAHNTGNKGNKDGKAEVKFNYTFGKNLKKEKCDDPGTVHLIDQQIVYTTTRNYK